MPLQPPIDDEITEEQYLVREPQAEYKSEFRQGRIVDMSGASPAHVRISGNLFAELHKRLKGKPCQANLSDQRTKVAAARLYTYPDVTVVCGKAQYDVKDRHALINPTVIVEVLSPSTEKYDRGEKFTYYKKLESFQEYVLISQDKVHIEHYTRNAQNQWTSLKLHVVR